MTRQSLINRFRHGHGDEHHEGRRHAHDDTYADTHGDTRETATGDTRGATPTGTYRDADTRDTSRDTSRDADTRDVHDDERHHRREVLAARGESARDVYGGFNWGACFFGWLVAVGVTVLLAAIASAIATAIGTNLDLTLADAEENAATVGIWAAVTLAVVMFVGYYAGGYVAGRMSRFDGARQGVGVWIVGLLVMLLAAGVGALFGSQYDIYAQVDMPTVNLSSQELGVGTAITGLVLIAVMLVGAVLGGIVGHRYHDKVDSAAGLH